MLHERLGQLNDVINLDIVTHAEARVTSAVSYQPVDRLPVVVGCPVPGWPAFSYREGFYDMEKMLLNELASVWAGASIGDDRMHTIRANYGVGIIASMFGCEIVLTSDIAMPWVMPLTDEALDRVLESGQIDIEAGLGRRVFETEHFFLDSLSRYDKLAQAVHVYVCDTQGPFDIAHLVMGHKIYTEIYDNPERLRRLLELTTDTYIRFTQAQKKIIGESSEWSYHSSIKFRGAVRVCDDTGTNLSTSCYCEFSKPYNERVLAELGGGWVHFCGGGKQILSEVLSTQGATGINFGNPELQDIAPVYEAARQREMAVLAWRADSPLPCNITTGMTLITGAADIESAKEMLGS